MVFSYQHLECFIKLIKILTKVFSANKHKLTQIETVFFYYYAARRTQLFNRFYSRSFAFISGK